MFTMWLLYLITGLQVDTCRHAQIAQTTPAYATPTIMTGHSLICLICHDDLLNGFDDLGQAHIVVRLRDCGASHLIVWCRRQIQTTCPFLHYRPFTSPTLCRNMVCTSKKYPLSRANRTVQASPLMSSMPDCDGITRRRAHVSNVLLFAR